MKRCTLKVRRKRARRPKELICKAVNSVQDNVIRENFENSSFTVEQLAKQLHISRVQLYRKVKAVLGINISDYINNFKLENAKTQLENTKMTVSQIAYANGFSSPNYFSTTFKNKFGVSPGAYRKNKQ